MAIRKVTSRSITDGTIATDDIADSAVSQAKTTGLGVGTTVSSSDPTITANKSPVGHTWVN